MAEWDDPKDNENVQVTLTRGSLGYIMIFCRNTEMVVAPDEADSEEDRRRAVDVRTAIAEIRQELSEAGIVDPTLDVSAQL